MFSFHVKMWLVTGVIFAILFGSGFVSDLAAQQQNDADSGGDAGNSFDAAVTISSGQEYRGDVDSPTDTVDYFKFEVNKGQVITFTASYGGLISDNVEFALFAPDRSLITTDSFIYSTATSSGYHYFRVKCESGTVNYTFEISVLGSGNSENTGGKPEGTNLVQVAVGFVIIAVIVSVIFVLQRRRGSWQISAS